MKRNPVSIILKITLIIHLLASGKVNAQCTPMSSGHVVLSGSEGCAPFDMQIKNLYSNATADAEFRVDWGDGTVETFMGIDDPTDGGAFDPIYTPDFNHTYLANNTDCGYVITIEATNACTEAEDASLELSISVWDTDQIGLAINPGSFRVCQGFAASISFEDISDWNCFPRPTKQNDPPRWIQWIYQGGSMTIPGYEAAPILSTVTDVNNTGSTSNMLNIPANDPTNPGNPYAIGDNFTVTMNNWNRCNAYDNNLNDGNPLNPVTPGGDELPINTSANIVIVESPTPDFETKLENNAGVVKTVFCIDDIIYFDNNTATPPGANLAYQWQFYDGPDNSYTYATRTSRNPVYSYNIGGTKLIRLIVTDNNAIGGCSSVIESTIDIFPTSIAQLNVNPTSICIEESSQDTVEVTYTDMSVGTDPNTEWKWEFYNENGVLTRTEPAVGYSNSMLGPFTEKYWRPGEYRVVLITRDGVTQCDTRDEKTIVVYSNPVSNFEFGLTCENEDVEFYNKATLNVTNGNTLSRWEWDFDYDGATFIPDLTFNSTNQDTVTQSFPVGDHVVAYRVSENQNSCSSTFIDTVQVHPAPLADIMPDISGGCSPLDVEFTNFVHKSQPTNVDTYTWQIDAGSGFADSLVQSTASPTFDTLANFVFENYGNSPKTFDVQLVSLSEFGCTTTSALKSIVVNSTKIAAFHELNYNPLADNCAPIQVNFLVDAPTRNLSPDSYEWIISDKDTIVFYDSIPASQSGLAHTFQATGSAINEYTVRLRANVPGICMADSIRRIRVNPIPSAAFSVDTTAIDCDIMQLHIAAEQTGLDYIWTLQQDINIQTIDTLDDEFDWTINRSETAEILLNIGLSTQNFAACMATPQSIDLNVPRTNRPQASINTMPDTVQMPNATVFFSNLTSAGIWDYTWNLGDGTTSTEKYPQEHTYTAPGTYQVTMQAAEQYCSDADTTSVVVLPPPFNIDFTYDRKKGCVPLTVAFKSNSTNVNPGSLLWNFGDGQTSIVAEPTYTFTEPGIYTISLYGSDFYGAQMTEEKVALIEVLPTPTANFGVSPMNQAYPETTIDIVNMSVVYTSAPSYTWDFNDNTFDYTNNPETHTYDDPGQYVVKLSINENGCVGTDSVTIRIQSPLSPILDFEANPTAGCVPHTVEFVNLSLNDDLSEFEWSFGEREGISYDKNPTYTYTRPGVYTVKLTASNPHSETVEIIKEAYIEVVEMPNAKLSVPVSNQVFPDATFTVENHSTGTNATYIWDFGDNQQSFDKDPGSHTYNDPGLYNIQLQAQIGICKDVDSLKVYLKPVPPIVDFEYDPASGCAPLTVHFTNLTQYADPSSYRWYFGDAGVSSNINPTFTFHEPGVYSVRLEAANSASDMTSIEKVNIITVHKNPYANFNFRPEQVRIPEESVYFTNNSTGADTYLWDFGDGSTSDFEEPVHAYEVEGIYDVTLIAMTDEGCADTLLAEQAIMAENGKRIRIPNAFTPSLDGPSGGHISYSGSNDIFLPILEGVVKVKLQIFNKWGEKVFETEQMNHGWDGYYKGRICPADVYVYKMHFKFVDGHEEEKFGDVTLIR